MAGKAGFSGSSGGDRTNPSDAHVVVLSDFRQYRRDLLNQNKGPVPLAAYNPFLVLMTYQYAFAQAMMGNLFPMNIAVNVSAKGALGSSASLKVETSLGASDPKIGQESSAAQTFATPRRNAAVDPERSDPRGGKIIYARFPQAKAATP